VLELVSPQLIELFAADSVDEAIPIAKAAHAQMQTAAMQVQELYTRGLELAVIDLEQVAPIPTPEPTATPTKQSQGAGPSPSPTEALET
ncbi:hypothetical protein, partial [Salmonella sp. SAL4458]|uniref:hypothetical protein n=1 Tax=Salmonella sp. SAL4458 TaxID=3159913 RepID=UPI00397E564A